MKKEKMYYGIDFSREQVLCSKDKEQLEKECDALIKNGDIIERVVIGIDGEEFYYCDLLSLKKSDEEYVKQFNGDVNNMYSTRLECWVDVSGLRSRDIKQYSTRSELKEYIDTAKWTPQMPDELPLTFDEYVGQDGFATIYSYKFVEADYDSDEDGLSGFSECGERELTGFELVEEWLDEDELHLVKILDEYEEDE